VANTLRIVPMPTSNQLSTCGLSNVGVCALMGKGSFKVQVSRNFTILCNDLTVCMWSGPLNQRGDTSSVISVPNGTTTGQTHTGDQSILRPAPFFWEILPLSKIMTCQCLIHVATSQSPSQALHCVWYWLAVRYHPL